MPEALHRIPNPQPNPVDLSPEKTHPEGNNAMPSQPLPSQPSNFQKIIEFHKCFGLKHADRPQMNIFEEDPKCVKLRLNLIREELKELEEACEAKDMTEALDALGDILYVTYGAGSSFGLDLDKAFGLIHESNMSKLCKNEEEAVETVQWYKDNYCPKKYPYDSPNYRLSDDGQYYVVYNESSGKILKSVKYSPVKFDSMIPN